MNSFKLKTLILAAGFGTRLKEYGEQLPKGLIPYKQTTLIGNLISELNRSNITSLALITNDKYFKQYKAFASLQESELTVINNRSTAPENRKGALGDLQIAIKELCWEKENILVVPSDTYFEFPLSDFIAKIKLNPNHFHTIVRKMDSELIANRLGCAVVNEHNHITSFEEKPANPPSNYAAIPFYYYPHTITAKLHEYRANGYSMDAPGSIIPWLIKEKLTVYAHIVTQPTIDVGTLQEVKLLQSQHTTLGL